MLYFLKPSTKYFWDETKERDEFREVTVIETSVDLGDKKLIQVKKSGDIRLVKDSTLITAREAIYKQFAVSRNGSCREVRGPSEVLKDEQLVALYEVDYEN